MNTKANKKSEKLANKQSKPSEFMDDKSRWNYSLQPGWTKEEAEILEYALQYYGVGRWKQIVEAKVLPSKNIQQMYLHTQRLIGQQSLAEFMGLHLDIKAIREKNALKEGKRKMGFLINEDDKLTKDLREQKQKENKQKYGLSNEQIQDIKLKLPPPSEVAIFNLENIINSRKRMSTIEKIVHLNNLEEALLVKVEKKDKENKAKNEAEQQAQANKQDKQKCLYELIKATSSSEKLGKASPNLQFRPITETERKLSVIKAQLTISEKTSIVKDSIVKSQSVMKKQNYSDADSDYNINEPQKKRRRLTKNCDKDNI